MCARRAIFSLWALLGLSLVAPASAAPEAASGVSLQTFEEGRKLHDQGRFADALRSFQASLALQPSPNTRLYIARCYRGLGKVASAHATFLLASREAEDRVSATGDQRYVATRGTATREAEELAPRVPRLSLSLRVEPDTSTAAPIPDAVTLTVDGEALPRVAWSKDVELDPGRHTVELSGHRVVPSRTEITLAEGQKQELSIVVRRVAAGGLVVRFRAKPLGMAAALDGEPLDLTKTDALREVRAGKHHLEVSAPGYATFVWDGQVNDGARLDVPVELQPTAGREREREADRGTPKWLFFTVAGAAVVSAGTGAVLYGHASSNDTAEEQKPVNARLESTRVNIQTEATVASVLFVAGGAAAVGATILAFTTRWGGPSVARDRRAGTSTRSLTVAPRGAGLGVEGTF